jgi:putative ABC transport system permease protein
MKTIDVRDQFRLGVARTFNLTVSGIRYRLFRSSVTVVVIAVAIAFLMNVVSEGLVVGAVSRMARKKIGQERQASWWAARLSVTGTPEEILLEIGRSGPTEPAYAEGMTAGDLAPEQMRSYREGAAAAALYVDFFENIAVAHRRILVGGSKGTDIFDRLQDAGEYERFVGELRGLKSVMFATSVEEFQSFLAEWPRVSETTLRISRGRAAAQAQIKERLGNRTVMDGLAEADGAFGKTVREAGFALDEATSAVVAVQARRILDMQRLEETVVMPEMRRAVAAYVNVMPAEVNALTLWELLQGQGSGRWYFDTLKDKGVDVGGIGIERATDLAGSKARNDALSAAERKSAGVAGGIMGIGERMSWLVAFAMLVCAVGVANAMLMSVTERFREIATLKCLGALDASIMLIFVMEASLLGAVGGVAGVIAGSVIGLGRMLVAFGGVLFSALPVGQLLFAVLLSTGSGVLLAAAAALYPSWRAATLAPMEAMRIQ